MCGEKPEEHIRLSGLIHSEESRVAANIVPFEGANLREVFRNFELFVLDEWRQEQRLTGMIVLTGVDQVEGTIFVNGPHRCEGPRNKAGHQGDVDGRHFNRANALQSVRFLRRTPFDGDGQLQTIRIV